MNNFCCSPSYIQISRPRRGPELDSSREVTHASDPDRRSFVGVADRLFPAPASGQAPEKTHPLTIHDMLAMDRISDTQVSPDGKWIAFTVRETDLAANRGRTDIWLVGTDGKGLRRLTNHPAADFNGRWTPCSQWIFFLSTRSGSSQIWRIKVDGGEAEQMTRLPLDVGNLLVAKAKLAFTMDVFPGLTPEATAAKLEAIEKDKATGRLYDKLFVRHWDTWSDGRRSHLFFMPMHGGGEAKDLMPAMDADTPNKPFGGTEEIAFTPDGTGLVFAAKDVGREEAWSTDSDLYYVPIDGSAAPRCLTEANKAMDTLPVFSPDGKTLAYVAMARPGYEADRYRIVLQPWPEGQPRVLTEAWDFSVASLGWAKDGKKLLATAPNKGQTSLFAVDAATGKADTLVGPGTVAGFAAFGDGVVFERNTLTSPTEIYPSRRARARRPSRPSTRRRSRRSGWASPSSSASRAGTTRRSTATSSSPSTSIRPRSTPSPS